VRIASAEEAARDIVAAVPVQPLLRMPLLDACGHVLGDDVLAGVALPPWTNAGMDGYAARADDLRGATQSTPARLRIIDSIAAGTATNRSLGAGEAARIFTGAPLPPGADSVIRQEDTARDGATVAILSDRDAGANVRLAGGDLALGALALGAGTVLGPHQIALLAALAVAHPVVHRRPRIGILTSGDELVSLEHPDEILAARKQADVNTPALATLVQQAGGIAVPLGIARDDRHELERLIAAADDIDMLITAGGVSVGDHDHIRAVMVACQVRAIFDRVRVRPGGPTAFAIFPNGQPWLALPGNPVSAMVTFELFGRPAIRRMAGHREPFRRPMRVILRDAVRRDATLVQYLRVRFIWRDDDVPVAELTGAQGSGMLMSIAHADGLVIIPAGSDVLAARSHVTAFSFG
jgi:molybdopterin molybdotransferase